MDKSNPLVCVIGSGPAGLSAAEAAADAGARVLVADQKSSLGRKFLMAGKSGLNLTKDEPAKVFRTRISASPVLDSALGGFGPQEVKDWAAFLGQKVFTGSSGRVFPRVMKASPLLRAWLARLAEKGVEFRTRWRWTGWQGDALAFDTPDGTQIIDSAATVLALGGGSWARLGSDGEWTRLIPGTVPFAPSNVGFRVDWSPHMQAMAGQPVKPVTLAVGETRVTGEFVITRTGVEGSAIYAISPVLMAAMADDGATLALDLVPDLTLDQVAKRLSRPRGRASLSNHLRKTLNLQGAKAALLREGGPLPDDIRTLAARIKAVPVHLTGPNPLDQAISTTGGLPLAALGPDLSLRDRPGVFAAGEMLDWDAPTGGYLITTCLATGRAAGRAAAEYALNMR